MKFLLNYLEIIFTVAGLVVIAAASSIAAWLGADVLQIAATTAIAVGVIHGVLFWLVRRSQRVARRVALLEAENMLRDVVNNHLAIIRMSSELQALEAGNRALQHLEKTQQSIDTIHRVLSDISEESIARWKRRYDFPAPPHS